MNSIQSGSVVNDASSSEVQSAQAAVSGCSSIKEVVWEIDEREKADPLP